MEFGDSGLVAKIGGLLTHDLLMKGQIQLCSHVRVDRGAVEDESEHKCSCYGLQKRLTRAPACFESAEKSISCQMAFASMPLAPDPESETCEHDAAAACGRKPR